VKGASATRDGAHDRYIPLRPEPALPLTMRKAVAAALARHRHRPGPLLEVLHAVQDALGHVPDVVVPFIAHELNLSRAEVHGVVSFYHYFRRTPPGRQRVSVCRAEACQAVGGRALEQHARQRLGIDFHETSRDGAYSLDAVYCLGNCAAGPSVMIDGELQANVTPERFDQLIGAGQHDR